MYADILVAIDGSSTAENALHEAIAVALACRARLTALYVLSLSTAFAEMQMADPALFERHLARERRAARSLVDHAAPVAAMQGIQLRTVVREAHAARPSDAILEEASAGYDLLVIGTHGRTGWSRLVLGSEAERTLRRAPIPVLLVRGDSKQAASVPAP